MTGNLIFEESWMGPFWRIKDAFVSCAEDYAPPAGGYHGPLRVGESQERVIRDDQRMNVHFHWINEGFMTNFVDPAKVEWHLDLFVEGMGQFFEGAALYQAEAYLSTPGPVNYDFNYNLDPSKLIPNTGKWPAGVYELVATIRLVEIDANGNVVRTLPMVGFAELGKLAIYKG